MNPIFLRRFGAALVCSYALAASLAFATDPGAASPATGDGAAKSDGPKAAASAKSQEGSEKGQAAQASQAANGDAKPDAADADSAKAGSSNAAAAGPDGARYSGPKSGPLQTAVKAKEEAEREGRRHGTRSKTPDGTLIVWDNVNSVWVAAESKNTYWVVDRYYRFDDGLWLESASTKGPWELRPEHRVPEAARDRHGPPKESVTPTLPSGIEAIYDPRIKVFKIAGRRGIFLFDASFYRYDGGVWLESVSVDGPWEPTSATALPQTLRQALSPPAKGSRVTLPGGDVLVSEGLPNLFAVEGRPDAIYFDGAFFERRNQKWFKSKTLASGWEEVPSQKVPGMVRQNYHQGGDRKGGRGVQKKGGAKADATGGGDVKKSGAKKAGADKAGGKKNAGERAANKKSAAASGDDAE